MKPKRYKPEDLKNIIYTYANWHAGESIHCIIERKLVEAKKNKGLFLWGYSGLKAKAIQEFCLYIHENRRENKKIFLCFKIIGLDPSEGKSEIELATGIDEDMDSFNSLFSETTYKGIRNKGNSHINTINEGFKNATSKASIFVKGSKSAFVCKDLKEQIIILNTKDYREALSKDVNENISFDELEMHQNFLREHRRIRYKTSNNNSTSTMIISLIAELVPPYAVELKNDNKKIEYVANKLHQWKENHGLNPDCE